MTWQILTAINVATASAVIPLQRLLLHKHKSDPIAFVIISQSLTALLLFVYVAFHGFHPPDLSKYWLLILLMFMLYSAGHILYAITLKRVEASIFTTVFNSNVIWVILIGYLVFHESVHLIDVIGSLLIIGSIFMLAERSGKIKFDRGLWLGILIGIVFSIAFSIWIYIGRRSDLATWNALSFIGVPIIVFLLRPSSARQMKPFLQNGTMAKMLLLAVFWAASNVASLAAYQRGDVSIIAPLQRTSVVITVLVAIIFLHERSRLWNKTLAALVCFAGVLLIIR